MVIDLLVGCFVFLAFVCVVAVGLMLIFGLVDFVVVFMREQRRMIGKNNVERMAENRRK